MGLTGDIKKGATIVLSDKDYARGRFHIRKRCVSVERVLRGISEMEIQIATPSTSSGEKDAMRVNKEFLRLHLMEKFRLTDQEIDERIKEIRSRKEGIT